MSSPALDETDYRTLLAFRMALTRFLHWRAEQTQDVGVTPQQHNLLLAIRAHTNPSGPSVRELSDYLMLRHHSTVELVNRAQAVGMVRRTADPEDRRIVRVRLTSAGRRLVRQLEEVHREELRQIAPAVSLIFGSLGQPPPAGDQDHPVS